MMRYNALHQFYKRFMITDIRYKRLLHLCSSIIPSCDISQRSANKTFITAKHILYFSNTSYVQGKTEIMSGEGESKSIVNYNGILQAQKDDSVLIIDVREQSEINETGKLPGSIHIPMGDVASNLRNLSEEDFEKKYNKSKPCKDTKIVLSCRSGKRSGIVQEDLQKIGYENVYNYIGGWLDWESHTK